MLGDREHWGERTQGDRDVSFQLSLRGVILQRNPLNLLKPPVVLSSRGSGVVRAVGNGNPLQYSCLENSMDRGAWRAIVHGVAKSWT